MPRGGSVGVRGCRGKSGVDGKPPTNLDRSNAATLLGRLRGEFVQRIANEGADVRVRFRGFASEAPPRVVDAEAAPTLPERSSKAGS